MSTHPVGGIGGGSRACGRSGAQPAKFGWQQCALRSLETKFLNECSKVLSSEGWGPRRVGGPKFRAFFQSPATDFALFVSHCVSSR